MLAVNEKGYVVNYVLTQGQGHEELKSFLESIKNQCPDLKMIATGKNWHLMLTFLFYNWYPILDNCCHDRKSFINAWGEEIRVVLDTFHAMQVSKL